MLSSAVQAAAWQIAQRQDCGDGGGVRFTYGNATSWHGSVLDTVLEYLNDKYRSF